LGPRLRYRSLGFGVNSLLTPNAHWPTVPGVVRGMYQGFEKTTVLRVLEANWQSLKALKSNEIMYMLNEDVSIKLEAAEWRDWE